ncbi:hypothetical protein F5890DRAFT_652628 [Lentinula detonsa]|uniref:Secreted protein n=1 Tax=Lentinula detonsa TaxID=2804962 RepID=A0AA38UPK5_9AGAR|nr:hypothetical protein F5890DRAFT_652628 [Lentinula detonsa]
MAHWTRLFEPILVCMVIIALTQSTIATPIPAYVSICFRFLLPFFPLRCSWANELTLILSYFIIADHPKRPAPSARNASIVSFSIQGDVEPEPNSPRHFYVGIFQGLSTCTCTSRYSSLYRGTIHTYIQLFLSKFRFRFRNIRSRSSSF